MSTTVEATPHNNSGSTSVDHVEVAMPAGILDGDVLILHVTAERATAVPTVPTGLANALTTISNTAGTAMSWYMGYAPVGPGDSEAVVSSFIPPGDGSVVRRQAIGGLLIRGCVFDDIVTALGTYTANADGVVTATGPSVTPDTDDSLLVGIMASCSNVTPYVRTKTANSPYTQAYYDSSTSAASTNAEVTAGYRQLSGGGGASQSGCVFQDTTTPTPTKFHWIAATLAIGPSLISPVAIPQIFPIYANMRSVW